MSIKMKTIMNEVTPVTCAIIIDKGKVLAALRSRQMSQSWKWEFPGGKIDEGETAEACICREVNEELSIHIKINQQLTPVIHSYPERTIKLIPFICSIESGELNAVEHEKVCWFSPDELPALNWAEADRPIMTEFLKHSSVLI